MTVLSRFVHFLPDSSKQVFIRKLRKVIGFWPRQQKLYELAFIHKSTAQTDDADRLINNERLEFLGDAILGSVIGEYLYEKYPEENEGFLTKMRSKMVNGDKLSELALIMELDQILQNNVVNDQSLKHISGDALEALIGAIYLDKGYTKAKHFILEKIVKKHLDIHELEKLETNYKSQLIEWAQKEKKVVTFYTDSEPYEPNSFISYASIDDRLYGSGSGSTKKEAEQQAALETLNELKI